MLIRNYIFQNNKKSKNKSFRIKHKKKLICIFLYFSLFSCISEGIWQYNIEEVKAKLGKSDFDFLYLVDFNEYSSSEILKLGEEAPFYLYFIFKDLGLNTRAIEMLNLLHKRGNSIYTEEAVLMLFDYLLQNEEYEELEDKSFDFLLRIPDSSIKYPVLDYYIRALYWQEKDRKVLNFIKNIFNDLNINMETFNEKNNTSTELPYYELSELILFKAVSSSRLNALNWTEIFENLFMNQSVSELHVRAYKYLTLIEPDKIFSFSFDMQELFKGKYLLAIGDTDNGIDSLKTALEIIEPEKLKYSPLIKELGFAFLNSQAKKDGAVFLDRLSEYFSGEKQLEIFEMAGRIYNKQKVYDKAYDRLTYVINKSSEPLQKDRCYWFRLDILLNESPDSAMEEIILNSDNWSDLEYFEDQIHNFLTELLIISDFEKIKNIYNFFKEKYNRPVNFLLRAEYILLRNGYLDSTDIPLDYYSGFIKPYMTIELYYYILISFYNDTLEQNILKIINPVDPGDNTDKYAVETQYDKFITGFFSYGIPEHSFDYIIKYLNKININTLFLSSKILNQNEYYLESIRLISNYFSRRDVLPNNRELLISYPDVFNTEINELSKKDNLDAPVIYGIIRSESAFSHGISSYAGAIGLMQLLPDTAEEMAVLVGITDIDLTNPYQNLVLGIRYIEFLNNRFDTLSKTVMAYNAGPGNMRKWQSQFYNYSSDMLSEIIPFAATKYYVKKVFITSIIYSVLYGYNYPEHILLLFYPDLAQ